MENNKSKLLPFASPNYFEILEYGMQIDCFVDAKEAKYYYQMTTPRGHVVITGTGRAGTTFLVQLLTNLKLDTGYNAETMRKGIQENARAGLENDVRKDSAPYIVKSTFFCDYAGEVVKREDIRLEHVFVPMRDLFAAAESRRFVTRKAVAKMPFWKRLKCRIKPPKLAGGLMHSRAKGKQEKILMGQLYNLILALSEAHIPVTLLQFPKLVRDSTYLYEKLKPILGHISYAEFASTFDRTVRPELIHDFGQNGSSESHTVLRTQKEFASHLATSS
jgi:hypothetical protein